MFPAAARVQQSASSNKEGSKSRQNPCRPNLPASRRCFRVQTRVPTVWSAASSYREDFLMCWPSNKVVKSDSKTNPGYQRVTQRQVMRHFTSKSNGTDQSQNGSSNKPPGPISRVTSIDSNFVVAYPRQPSQQQSGQITLQTVLSLKATHHAEIRKIEIPRSMVVEASSW